MSICFIYNILDNKNYHSNNPLSFYAKMNKKRKIIEQPEGIPQEKRGKRRPLYDPDRIHVCLTCQKGFVTPAQLREHGVTHFPPKFACSNCPFTCRRPTQLKYHEPKCRGINKCARPAKDEGVAEIVEQPVELAEDDDTEIDEPTELAEDDDTVIDEPTELVGNDGTEIDELGEEPTELVGNDGTEIDELGEEPSATKPSKNGIRASPDDPRRQNNICPTCQKGYVTQNQLSKHRKTHEEKLHRCSQCPYAGRFPESLRNHMVTHTGHRPYYCSECELGFLRPCEFSRHNKDYHARTSKEQVVQGVIKAYMCMKCNVTVIGKAFFRKHAFVCHKE